MTGATPANRAERRRFARQVDKKASSILSAARKPHKAAWKAAINRPDAKACGTCGRLAKLNGSASEDCPGVDLSPHVGEIRKQLAGGQ
jgi:hypothetical protein